MKAQKPEKPELRWASLLGGGDGSGIKKPVKKAVKKVKT